MDHLTQIAKKTRGDVVAFSEAISNEWADVESALLARGWKESSITSLYIECQIMAGKKTGRTNKPGAGRPKELREPTIPIRVPKSLASWIKENLDKIRHLKDSE